MQYVHRCVAAMFAATRRASNKRIFRVFSKTIANTAFRIPWGPAKTIHANSMPKSLFAHCLSSRFWSFQGSDRRHADDRFAERTLRGRKPAAAKNAPSQVFGRERLLAATLVKRGKTACRSRVRGSSAATESKVVEQTSAANRRALTSVWNKPDVAIRRPIALAGAVPLYWPFAHRASYPHPTRRISCREYARPPRAVPVFPHITGIHISMPIHFLFDFA